VKKFIKRTEKLKICDSQFLKVPNGKTPAIAPKHYWCKIHYIVYHFKMICDILSKPLTTDIVPIAAAKPKKIENTTICRISLVAIASKYSLEQYAL
jgi:hypothetical protein